MNKEYIGTSKEKYMILSKQDALNDGTLHVPKVEWCRPADLEYNARTGKLKVIIDKRK